MGGATSSVHADVEKYKVPVTEASALVEQCQELEARIAQSPEAVRYCTQVFETYKADDDNVEQLQERKAKILETFMAFNQLCTPKIPKTADDIIEQASSSLNLSGAREEPDESAGYLYVFGIPKLPEFPNLASKDGLQVLILKANAIKTIPGEALTCLKSLQHLDVSLNQLEELPDEIGELTKLEELRAAENNLNKLPETFGKLSALKTLIVYKNRLTEIPKTLGNCLQLEEVNFFNNKLIRIDKCFSELVELKELNLGGNKLKTLPSTSKWAKLEILTVSWNNLVVIPEFQGMIKLQQLRMNRNQLAELPEGALSDSKDLEVVDFSSNRFESVPASLYSCAAMKSLNFASNQLATLKDLSAIKALKILNLSDNKLETIEEGNLEQCQQLITLLLNSNKLKGLPSGLTKLDALERCNIAGNPDIKVEEQMVKLLSNTCDKNKGRWIS